MLFLGSTSATWGMNPPVSMRSCSLRHAERVRGLPVIKHNLTEFRHEGVILIAFGVPLNLFGIEIG